MLALIAAIGKNGVIGKGGKIPWKIKGEQLRFKELTMGNVVVMGRRTYEEIGKPLSGRTTIVLSKTKKFEGTLSASSLFEAISLADGKDIFIAGGEALYREALPLADKLFITEVEFSGDGDAFFPSFKKDDFTEKIEALVQAEIPYRCLTYTRKV